MDGDFTTDKDEEEKSVSVCPFLSRRWWNIWAAITQEAMFVSCKRTIEGRGRGYQLIRTAPLLSGYSASLRGRTGQARCTWAGPVSPERIRWAGHTIPALYDDPAHLSTTNDVSRLRIANKPSPLFTDLLIRCLTQQIEDLHISEILSAPKNASSTRSVDWFGETAIWRNWPESAKVLRHNQNSKLRMLTHRWKKLGLPDPVRVSGKDHTPEQSHRKKQFATKTGSWLKKTPTQASNAAAQRENEQVDALQCLSSDNFPDGLPEGKLSDKHMSGSSECHTDSTLSDQEQERVEMSKWATESMGFDLKPQSFREDLDTDYHFTETAVYPDVLPAVLLDSTQSLSSETQQSVDVTDPCLASVITRLIELERLQDATVQKERAKQTRCRPATAYIRNGGQLKKSNFQGYKTEISRDVACNSVMCSFSKLLVCPNSSCRCRHRNGLTKSGQGSKTKVSHTIIPNCNSKTAETAIPNVSGSVKAPQKFTMPNRTKSSKAHRGSMTDRKARAPNKKT